MNDTLTEATETLQQLGLKEYESRCFIGLSRLSTATAKQLSEITDVPRTRVYDAIRILEAQGLVEIHHSSPQEFRAVPVSEATEILRNQYTDRIDRLTTALNNTEQIEPDPEETVQEIWTMSGTNAIANRTIQLTGDASEEVLLVLGDSALLTEKLVGTLNDLDPEVELLVGAITEPLQQEIQDAVPDATTFISGLGWLRNDLNGDDDLRIGRLLLVDRSTILVSTVVPESREEQAIFGGGFRNGLVVIARRLLAQGLISNRDPDKE